MTTTPLNIAGSLRRYAQEQPDTPAIIMAAGRAADGRAKYKTLTFAEVERESDAYARGLQLYGINRGQRVLLLVTPGIELLTLAFSLFKLGAPPIVIDAGMGRQNLLACIEECAPEALIAVPRGHVARMMFPKAFRSVQRHVTVGRKLFWSGKALDDLRLDGTAPFQMARTLSDETAAIAFTTGSTGLPKGVVYEHGMFAAQIAELRRLFGIQPGEIDVAAFPLFALFDILLGATVAVPDMDVTKPARCDPKKIIEIIVDQKATLAFGSPAIWERVTGYGTANGIKLPTLRRVIMAGAPVRRHIHERFHNILVAPGDTYTPYGATESLPVTAPAGRDILAAIHERPEPTNGTCVGLPAPGVSLRVIKIEDGPIATWSEALVLPQGQIGEVAVKGPFVTRRYFGREEATRLAKIQEGPKFWHRMGDVGYLDEKGRLWFCGRKAHRVELGSETLHTDPVENVFNLHPAVSRSALVKLVRSGKPEALVIVEPLAGNFPRTKTARQAFTAELKQLGSGYRLTAGITNFMFHPAFPVDLRHNAKIFREKLTVWAQAKIET